MATCDVDALMAESACWNNLTTFQLRVVQVELLRQILVAQNPAADVTPEALLESGKCFVGIEPGFLNVIVAQLLCELITP